MTADLAICSTNVVLPSATRPATVLVEAGRIAAIRGIDWQGEAIRRVDLGTDFLLPGLVDAHVHVNAPGREEFEGYETATLAAAAGGVTTLIDMPLGCVPPTTSVEALDLKRDHAVSRCHVDVGFWGGAVPGNVEQLKGLQDAGVFGFKCLMTNQAAEFPALRGASLLAAAETLAEWDALLIVHAEDAAIMAAAGPAHGRFYGDYLASSPEAAELVAITRLVEICRATGVRTHILHLSAASALPVIAEARADGLPITVETCPHYLTFAAEDIPDGATTFKCSPPVRSRANQEALWGALSAGVIDTVVTDHAACTAEAKSLQSGDFGAAWPGISGLQLGLAAVWTGAQSRGIPLDRVVEWMSARPAEIVGLRRKGAIEVGAQADLVWFDARSRFVVDPRQLHHRNPITAYAGRELCGVVRRTWLRGEPVEGPPRGHLLEKGTQ